jgi:hypothetical protein
MNSTQVRGLLAVVNVALVGAIFALGVRTFRGVEPGPSEKPPADFDPRMYEIKQDGGPRSSVDEHRVTWLQLDRAAPPPPPSAAVDVGPTGPPTPQDLSRLYTLVMASFNERAPDLSTFIIQGRDGTQRTFSIGDSFDGYRVMDIKIEGDGEAREAIVTVQSTGGTRDTIRLRRKSQP